MGRVQKAVANYERTVIKGGKKVTEQYKACAGAHDLRRSFCSRWAKKVMPAVLQRLAGHSNIGTTMGFHVFLDVDEIGADLWANHDNKPPAGNTSTKLGAKGEGASCHKPLRVLEKRKKAPPGFEPGMMDLQSTALATWPRRHLIFVSYW